MVILQKICYRLRLVKKSVLVLILMICAHLSYSQLPRIGQGLGNLKSAVGSQNTRGRSDTSSPSSSTMGFEHRDDAADSITISYRYLDSLKSDFLDSTIDDFNKVYTVPPNYVTLGNNGNAAYPVLFTPFLKAGWDAGFHAFDAYKYTIENTEFYKTTRPFTQLSYFLASGKEQVVKVLQTQNIKPNWNAGIDYRLISSPGFFQTQNTNHNNYRFFSNYQGKRKRYSSYLVLLGNKFSSSENGGIMDDSLLKDPGNKKRFTVPVNLGGDVQTTFNVFSTKLNTGNQYSNFTAFFRQSYDLGIKDSIIINDSTTNYLFYPKLRFQHTISYTSSSYKFKDTLSSPVFAQTDSAFFKDRYDTTLNPANGLNFSVQDKWKFVSNDFVIRQFPETKNPGQYIEAGLRVENFSGYFYSGKKNFYNVVLHGEYRNKTRNQKWDALVNGEFYATGLNAADFNMYANLTRFLNKKLGDVQVSFQNVNRSPSYIYAGNSSFNFDNNSITKKENITVLTATANNPKFRLMARNISIANYTYFKNFYQADQFNGLVNITQFTASTKNKIIGHLNLYSDFIVQQTAGNNPVKVPLLYTRQRLALEGLFFKNLNLSTGLEVKYNTPYKAYNYSPVMGKFFPQDSITITNLPEVNLFFNFRIKSFSAFIRMENLNTVDVTHGFGFTNNNFAAPLYPTPGFLFRFAIQWRFVN
ncbi:MAG: putative porin [Bacteroidota bacterium]|nr:putative porin [Bacteroidota bacterium]